MSGCGYTPVTTKTGVADDARVVLVLDRDAANVALVYQLFDLDDEALATSVRSWLPYLRRTRASVGSYIFERSECRLGALQGAQGWHFGFDRGVEPSRIPVNSL